MKLGYTTVLLLALSGCEGTVMTGERAGGDIRLIPDDESGCVPQCGGRECGPDSCGGQCAPGCDKDDVCGTDGTCRASEAGCTPDCSGRECGPDGCGGECSPGCAEGAVCGGDGACVGAGDPDGPPPPGPPPPGPPAPGDVEGCPPAGPFGRSEGQIAPDASLYDCDGNRVGLHSLCGFTGSYVYTFAEWCGNCVSFARNDANDVYAQYQPHDFQMFFVVTRTLGYEDPSPADCVRIRDTYGLNMPVLVDTDNVLETQLGMRPNTSDMVMSQGNVIETNGPWAFFSVEPVIRRVLGL